MTEAQDCDHFYNDIYQQEIARAKKKNTSAENAAQKRAIRDALIKSMQKYPETNPAILWDAIHSAHLFRKSGVSDPKIVSAVVSAEESWKKSSGHAFEEMIISTFNEALRAWDITIHLQREIRQLFSEGKIGNSKSDLKDIISWLDNSDFDLYLTVSMNDQRHVFGCAQSKTSIRDRVTRDREPSITAMNHNFWSIAIVLDGDFLKLPKFQKMVNGGGSVLAGNGWHGLYAFSVETAAERIYRLDRQLAVLVDHAKVAAQFWKGKRQWMKPGWSVEEASQY